MTSIGVTTSTMLPVRQLRHWVSYAETWPSLQRKPRFLHHQTEINRIENVQRTAARWACTRWRNQSRVGEMLDELQWPELQERRQQASLTSFYKIHNNLVVIDKNRYLSEAGRGNRSTRSHPFQYHRPNAYTGLNIPFSPGQLQLGMDLQPKMKSKV